MSKDFGIGFRYVSDEDDGSDDYVISSYLSQSVDSDLLSKVVLLEEQNEHVSDSPPDQNADEQRDNAGRTTDTQAMNESDYRHELSIRDDQIRREMGLREESFRAEQRVRDKALDERFSGFLAAQAERDKRIDKSLADLSESQKDIKGSISAMKTTIIVTAITTVAAIVIGIGGFNAMLTSNMVASFQMGRSEQAYQKPAEQPASAAPAPTQQK